MGAVPRSDGGRSDARAVEALHAVVYFAPEVQEGYAALGLRGYWRGYFAGRTAALGRCSAPLGTAVCGGFAPSMVERALPAVWELAAPKQVAEARTRTAGAALRRLLGPVDGDLLREAAQAVALPGRPLAAAQAALPRPADPHEALWHDATVLREARGDAHLAVVAVAGLRWPEPHLLLAGLGRLDPHQQEHRGWDDAAWSASRDRLRTDGLLDDDGRATDSGEALAERLEQQTDDTGPDYPQVDREALAAAGQAAAVELPFPNAMGLLSP